MGADDYITKPFNPMEVLARVRSQLRRYTSLGGMEQKPNRIVIGGIAWTDDTKTVTVDGEPVSLTPIEYNILLLLMRHPGRVYSSAQIYEKVWNEKRPSAPRGPWRSTSGTCGRSWRSTPPNPGT